MFSLDTLLWIALLFLGGAGIAYQYNRRTVSRHLGALGWLLFGLFWLSMTPHFLFTADSIIEGVGCLLALPIGGYLAYLTYTDRVPVLFDLSRGVAIMGLIYLPVERIPALRRTIMEAVAVQTVDLVELIFNQPLAIQEGPKYGYQTGISYLAQPGGGPLYTHIELACTGLGSIAIVVGILSILKEPARVRIPAILFAAGAIYVFNLLRTVFITAAFGGQWFQIFVPQVLAFTGYEDARIASFFIADKVISQSLSVLVLVGMFVVISRVFPSLRAMVLEIVEAGQTLTKRNN